MNLDSLKCGLGGTGPDCPPTTFVPQTCAQLNASNFDWILSGFTPRDILDPDVRSQPQLTALLHVGDTKTLKVAAGSTATTEDCSSKATSVEWLNSNPAVVRLDPAGDPRKRILVALQPGDAVIAATLAFDDGTPQMRAMPWSFTNVGSGQVTVVRVLP